MDKALQSMRAEADRAFRLVVDHYANYGLYYPERPIFKLFHFVEAKRWVYYLKHVAHFNVAEDRAGEIEGVTHSYADQPQIGINRDYHSYATLVHESIHFFSHYEFRKAFTVNEYEGATEYLARNLLDDFSPRRDSNGEGDIYAKEFTLFATIIKNKQSLQQLCKAYFCGDIDIISNIKNQIVS